MKQTGQVPLEIRLVSTECIPDNLFVCSAKIEPEAGKALRSALKEGAGLSKDLQAIYNKHLIYAYGLGEKGLYWEAGPSADFAEILYIFSTGSLGEAQKLMYNDPLYKAGIFHSDWWLQWVIHCPIWKAGVQHAEQLEMNSREFGVLPKYPPGIKPQVKEIKIRSVTPPKLFASIAKIKVEYMEKMIQDMEAGRPLPVYFLHHVFYRLGVGGTGPMGYDWESGPSIDWSYDISIFSVNSVETARFLSENDAFDKYEIFHDRRYFEWYIHMPFRKASPTHKESLRRFLGDAGVALSEE